LFELFQTTIRGWYPVKTTPQKLQMLEFQPNDQVE